ncbi:MAG TPA: zinc-ribbon domain containing protein [Rhodocyclaceae bacterium]|nr:zinc-ribbon domain containing protein [Rhodocyclaceae bacterium]
MKSGKMRRSEIKAARLRRAARANLVAKLCRPLKTVPVNPAELALNNSYGWSDFELRGYYADQPFRCRDCGADCVWNAEDQKWWYEVIKGSLYTTAVRCKACRAAERQRKAMAQLPKQGMMSKS